MVGGGFCEKHGPFDPPHQTCPYCAREDQQRRVYGPPDAAPAPDADVDATGFHRQTVEPAMQADVTEVVPRPESNNGTDEPERSPLGWLIVKEPVEQRGATPLHENDEVRLGQTLFVFKALID